MQGLSHLMTISCFLLLWAACDSIEGPSGNDLETTFRLTDENGRAQTVFAFKDGIRFHYEIENVSSADQQFIIPDTGPIVTFEVLSGNESFGASDDGVAYALVIVVDTLSSGEKIVHEYSWFSYSERQFLLPGKYTAKAKPRLRFSQTETPGEESIEFEVVCDSSVQNCDTSNVVVITDTPADSLQLDAFALNSAAVTGDSLLLSVSYSGGCKKHVFDMFMTPASFMESFPVQANLILRHSANEDPCDAHITSDLTFDISPIADLFRQSYAPNGIVILNVFEYYENNPGKVLSVTFPIK